MTANLSLPLVAINYDRQTPSRASFNAPALVLVIDHLQSLEHVCGRVYLLNFMIPPFSSEISTISRLEQLAIQRHRHLAPSGAG